MSIRHLDALFHPKSLLVIGAEVSGGAPGTDALLAERLAQGGFAGPLRRVVLRQDRIRTDLATSADASNSTTSLLGIEAGKAPTLALICTPPADWRHLISELAQCGTHAAVLFGESDLRVNSASRAALLAAARPGMLRLIGPASAGIVSSRDKVNATIGNEPSLPGRVALVSQSRSFANAAISWAAARGIGFSRVVTTGLEVDVDCADLLDYLGSDPYTGAIALAIDFIAPSSVRKFMSAARAASRNKPVLVLRARHRRPDDALFSAAFRRAGMVRVDSIEDLLDAIETLHTGRFAGNDSVTIVSNGGFTGALGADALAATGGRLATLNDEVRAALADVIGSAGAGGADSADQPFADDPLSNPINLGETADVARYSAAIRALATFPASGALFVIHTPSVHAPATELADALIAQSAHWPRALLSSWLGDYDPSVRAALHEHKIAVYPTPQRLARAFARMREYQRNQILLAETPESLGTLERDKVDLVRQHLYGALAESSSASASASLPVEVAGDAALDLLSTLKLGVQHAKLAAMRSTSEPPSHQASALGSAAWTPAPSPYAHAGPAMHISIRRDALFGMVLGVTPYASFGTPSQESETHWAILPISTVLSGDLVARLPSAPIRGHASHRAFTRFLARLSELIVAVPEIRAMTLVAAHDGDGIAISDGALSIAPHHAALPDPIHRFAVRPYPAELETTIAWADELITIRPIRPQDEDAHRRFIDSVSADDMRLRFFGAIRTLEHSQLARLTQIDYDREMALIAVANDANGQSVTIGVVRAVADPDNETAEFAVMVRSDRKGLRLGALLMQRIIDYCRARGTKTLVGEVLSENDRMVSLARRLGFTVKRSDEPGVMDMTLPLT